MTHLLCGARARRPRGTLSSSVSSLFFFSIQPTDLASQFFTRITLVRRVIWVGSCFHGSSGDARADTFLFFFSFLFFLRFSPPPHEE